MGLHVATIFADVEGDTVGPAELGLDGCPDGVRFDALAGLADGGDVVDVYA